MRLKPIFPPALMCWKWRQDRGVFSIELARSGKLNVHALEISKTFVELQAATPPMPMYMSTFSKAMRLPCRLRISFDLLVCRAAFKHFSEPVKVLQEMHRVLRPGASGVIIDLRRDTRMSANREYVNGIGVGRISRWMTILTFRFMLLKRAYTRQEMEKMLAQVPFRRAEVQQNLLGMEVWFEK